MEEKKNDNPAIAKLVKDVLAGNHEAFREIVIEYSPGVRAFIARSISDPHTVDDLTQETFIAVYQSLDKYDEKLPLAPWISSIARNKLLMYLRQFYRYKGMVEEARYEIIEKFVVNDTADPEEEKNLISKLKKCLEKLPQRSRETIAARYEEKRTVFSLAQQFDTTVSAISSLLYHAKEMLRACMGNEIL